MAVCSCAMELAVEKRMKDCVSAWPKSRPGVTATWARFMSGDGAWAMDADVSAEGGAGEVQLVSLTLYAGGRCPLKPSTIG